MKNVLSLILLSVFIGSMSLGVFAQDDKVVQPKHPQRVYTDAEKARIYVWKTGLFLYFGTEDGQVAKRYQLINKESAGMESVTPFYLDTDGINSIIEPNPKNRRLGKDKKSEFLLYADWKAPKSSIKENVKFHIVLDKREIRGEVFDATVSSFERKQGSGIQGQFMSLNDKAYESYDAPLSITEEGLYTVRYYAVDNVGNTEVAKSQLYGLDLSPAVTAHTILTGNVGDILSPRAQISLSATDNMSGVKVTYFQMDGNKERSYKRIITTKKLPEGDHALTYHSHDRVKNHEEDIVYAFYLDRTAPVSELSVEGDVYDSAGKTYLSERSKVVLEAVDNKVDVKNVYYKINKGGTLIYGEAFPLVTSKINHTVSYWSDDVLLNIAKPVKRSLILDIELPTVGHDFDGNYFQARGIDYIHPDTTIVFESNDKISGVQSVMYTVSAGEAKDGSSGLNLSEHGVYPLAYYAMDNVNNKTNEKSAQIFVDSHPPVFNYEFGVKNLDGETEVIETEENAMEEKTMEEKTMEEKAMEEVNDQVNAMQGESEEGNSMEKETMEKETMEKEAVTHTFPEKVYLFLNGTDDDSGVKQIDYSVNGAAKKAYSNPIDFEEPGDYQVDITVIDNVGNTADSVVNFTITAE